MLLLLLSLGIVLSLPSSRGIHVGDAVNIFTSFGNLGTEINVNDQVLYPENPRSTSDVFDQVLESRRPIESDPTNDFNGAFLLLLCDDITHLMAALFLAHRLEGVERPWRAFAGGWSRATAGAYLGVNSTYLNGAHGYALLKLIKQHEQVTLSPDFDPHFNRMAMEAADKIVPDLPETVISFINTFGSHYVSSYVTGDSLYQVFVFAPIVYVSLQNAMKNYKETGENLDQLLEYFTPWHAQHIGRIVSLSGNDNLERYAEQLLRNEEFIIGYSSLLELRSAPDSLRLLDHSLENDALLEVELKSLAPYFLDGKRRQWFSEVLDNRMELWEQSV